MDIPFHKAYITVDEVAEVIDAIKSGWFTMGPKTVEFERRFSDFIFRDSAVSEDKRFSVSLNSATAALHLALKAIGLKAGDEVILPTNTFIATAEVVTYFGAVPVLCDIEEVTHNMDVSKIEGLITGRTRAIIPVHFGGQPCDMDEILDIAGRRMQTHDQKIHLIEDAAHALPSRYKGRMIGTIGDITCFSFYATKTLCTGEGGMAVTTNQEYAKKIRTNRLHGISKDVWNRYTLEGDWRYEVVDNGNKYNTTDLNSALGLAQLQKVLWMNDRRREIAELYTRAFEGTGIIPPTVMDDRETSWHLYVIKTDNRDELYEKLRADGIGASVHFIPVHKHPYYRETYGYNDADYPVANRVFGQSLSLPIFPGLTAGEAEYITERVRRYAG
ncbi:MAG: DegT/DnrJ/EryC1/StrS family aminotransferase [Nitrospirae bacterium]|nr:DegT/DnrJ/EryC1/StrS family aminotransferase [Nitrospirota bacterium]